MFDGAEFSKKDFPNVKFVRKVGCILLSQSGETQDLYRCIKIAREVNAQLIGIVNAVDSLIAREVDCGVYLNAGREVAVASTKAFTSQLTVLALVACWFSQLHTTRNLKLQISHLSDMGILKNIIDKIMDRAAAVKELSGLQRCIKDTIDISVKQIDDDILTLFDDFDSCFIIGKGTGEGIAREGALKIKEIAYIHAEGYSAR